MSPSFPLRVMSLSSPFSVLAASLSRSPWPSNPAASFLHRVLCPKPSSPCFSRRPIMEEPPLDSFFGSSSTPASLAGVLPTTTQGVAVINQRCWATEPSCPTPSLPPSGLLYLAAQTCRPMPRPCAGVVSFAPAPQVPCRRRLAPFPPTASSHALHRRSRASSCPALQVPVAGAPSPPLPCASLHPLLRATERNRVNARVDCTEAYIWWAPRPSCAPCAGLPPPPTGPRPMLRQTPQRLLFSFLWPS